MTEQNPNYEDLCKRQESLNDQLEQEVDGLEKDLGEAEANDHQTIRRETRKAKYFMAIVATAILTVLSYPIRWTNESELRRKRDRVLTISNNIQFRMAENRKYERFHEGYDDNHLFSRIAYKNIIESIRENERKELADIANQK